MGHFVDKKLIAITDDASGDTIWIVPKLSWGARNAAQDALVRANVTEDGTLRRELAVGAYMQELLCQAIVRWSGPGFAGVECTRAAILDLDYEDPLFVKVLDEVNRRNSAGGEDPKLAPAPAPPAGSDGGSDSGVIDVIPIPPAVAA